MIKRTPNRDISLVSGSDIGVDKSWMPLGMFQLSTEDGALLQKTAQGIVYREISETVELGGSFNAGESVRCTRVGPLVNITSVGGLSHASGTSAASSSGAIPEKYRPSSNANDVYAMGGSDLSLVGVFTNGIFFVNYRDWSGSPVSKTSAGVVSITSNV